MSDYWDTPIDKNDVIDVKVGDPIESGRYTGIVVSIGDGLVTASFSEDKNYQMSYWTETFSMQTARRLVDQALTSHRKWEERHNAERDAKKKRSKGQVLYRGTKNAVICTNCDVLVSYVRDEEWYKDYRVELMFCPLCGGSIRKH